MTRTFKCTHFLTSKECVNHMMVHLTHQGFTKPQTAQLSNQVAGKLSFFGVWNQLGGVNNRQMGNRGSEISNSFHRSASSGALAKPSYMAIAMYSVEQNLLIQEEVSTLLGKGAVIQVYNPQLQGSFSWSPKRTPAVASDKPQEVKRMGDIPTLQDGKHGDPYKVAEEK